MVDVAQMVWSTSALTVQFWALILTGVKMKKTQATKIAILPILGSLNCIEARLVINITLGFKNLTHKIYLKSFIFKPLQSNIEHSRFVGFAGYRNILNTSTMVVCYIATICCCLVNGYSLKKRSGGNW
jgi:hypothetical protein